jgi:hypothetical protein
MKTKYFLPIAIFAVICFTAFGLTFNTATLQAAPQVSKTETAPVMPPSDSMKAKMEKAEKHLLGLEATLEKIERNRVIIPEDNEALDLNGLGLADTLNEAFQEASRSALDAAESEGKAGNVEDLVFFESFEQNHTSRTEAIVARTERIQKGIEDGTIILKQAPATPAKITNASFNRETKTSFAPGLSETANTSCGVLGSTSGSKILKPCIAPCIGERWAECASCIIRNVPAGIAQYNQFRNCWNNCGGFWKWFCRAKCLGTFVYWIY